jgi:hypothetical protein
LVSAYKGKKLVFQNNIPLEFGEVFSPITISDESEKR